MDMIFFLIRDDPVQLRCLLDDLDQLVPIFDDESGESRKIKPLSPL